MMLGRILWFKKKIYWLFSYFQILQGFSVTEADYNDVFLLTRSDLRGKVVAFLPHQRSLDVPQGEAMCNFLDRLLSDATMGDPDDESDVYNEDEEEEDIMSSPRRVVTKLKGMLESRKIECLGEWRPFEML